LNLRSFACRAGTAFTLVLGLHAVQVRAAEPVPVEVRARLVSDLVEKHVWPNFTLPSKLSDPLRSRAADIASKAIRVIEASLVEYGEHMAARTSVSLLHAALRARLMADFARWSAGAANARHDELLWAALRNENACISEAARTASLWAQRVARYQGLSEAEALEALALEEAWLLRWGEEPRSHVPPPALAAFGGLVPRSPAPAGQKVAVYAPAPVAGPAAGLEEHRLPQAVRCEARRKALLAANAQTFDQRMFRTHQFRTQMGVDAVDVAQWPRLPALVGGMHDGQPVGLAGQTFEVGGTVEVLAKLDGQGEIQSLQVWRRQLDIDGVPPRDMIAFERLLDQASIDKAAELLKQRKAGGRLVQGQQVVIPLIWRYE
jgi:hypothetical protein